jgi:hypothetical protein
MRWVLGDAGQHIGEPCLGIIGVLREQEAGAKTADICPRHGISEATFYNWKAKFAGMVVSDARRLKALDDDKGKQLVQLLMLRNVNDCGLGASVSLP